MPTGLAPKREAQVPNQISGGFAAIDRLSESIGQLEVRLCNVLRAESDPDKEKVEQEVEVLVPLASEIGGIRDRIVSQANRIESILERLEL